MTDRDDIAQLRDVPAALGLLSRLPVRVDTAHATARGAKAAWAYPVAGLVLGAIACLVAQFAMWLGLGAPLAAGLALASLVITTGAMHEDGLADCADGFWGGWDKARRLAIMKDSHIGVYGVAALVLSLGLRWLALGALLEAGLIWPALIATAMISRAAMVPLMVWLPHARASGLSHSVGRPAARTAQIALGLAALGALVLLQLAALWLVGAALTAMLGCAALARAKIGGQTGDTLGATQQITEIACLITLTAVLA